MTTRYAAFGLSVDSELTLPPLRSPPDGGTGDPDVTVTCGPVTGPTADRGNNRHRYVDDDEFSLSYGVCDATVRDGTDIHVDPAPGAPVAALRRLVVGPLFNYLLHQRGHLVIHASTVRIGDGAVAFVGDSGDGKSTTATAFLAAGHRVLSDDVAAISLDGGAPTVQPGYPAVKLAPDALEALTPPGPDPADADSDGSIDVPAATDALAPVLDGGADRPRRFHRVSDDWEPTPVPLAGVYLLEDGRNVEVLSLPPGRQCMALVEGTYTRGAFGLSGAAPTNFARCGSVADAVPVRRLRRPRQLGALPDLVDAVVRDLQGDG